MHRFTDHYYTLKWDWLLSIGLNGITPTRITCSSVIFVSVSVADLSSKTNEDGQLHSFRGNISMATTSSFTDLFKCIRPVIQDNKSDLGKMFHRNRWHHLSHYTHTDDITCPTTHELLTLLVPLHTYWWHYLSHYTHIDDIYKTMYLW